MAGKAPQKAAKVAKKAAPQQRKAKAAPAPKTAAKAATQKPAKTAAKKAPARTAAKKATATRPQGKGTVKAEAPRLLSGGNPQIAKGYGDAPVQAYIEAMPGWKRDVGLRLDALIERAVPGVNKAVKWNSPFYGVEGQGWFLGIHCFAKYIKVAFFRGLSLKPVPPGESKSQDTRYLDIRENVPLDEAQFTDWVKQASRLAGERM